MLSAPDNKDHASGNCQHCRKQAALDAKADIIKEAVSGFGGIKIYTLFYSQC